MAARLAEQLLHQLRCAVRHFGLRGEAGVAVHEDAELDDPLDARPVAAHRLADLRDEHQRAAARGVIAGRLVGVGAEPAGDDLPVTDRSEEHTSELQSLMRISYA